MNIQAEYSLQALNTLGIHATAAWYISYASVEELERLISDEYFQECRCLHIGEGSNLLFLTNFRGIVLRSELRDINIVLDQDETITLQVGAGLLWDDLVQYCVERGYYGLENLSLIPGQVGAAAIQNIGAYGVEVEQYIHSVETINRRTGLKRVFMHEECNYAYRYSIFKDADYADWFVISVTFCLPKKPIFNMVYAELRDYLSSRHLSPSLETVRAAVISIRQSKLPDCKTLGNAGSFFMNPILSAEQAKIFLSHYPEAPNYPQSDGKVKTSAAWLIERCGYKGYRVGAVGVYEKHALILVNYGGATGTDVASLAEEIKSKVRETFGIELIPEVRYIS